MSHDSPAVNSFAVNSSSSSIYSASVFVYLYLWLLKCSAWSVGVSEGSSASLLLLVVVGCCNSLPFFVIYLLIADWLIHYTVMPCSVLEMLVPQVDDYLWDTHDMGIHAMANP